MGTKVNDEDFVRGYMEAYKAGEGPSRTAKRIGVSFAVVYERSGRLIQRGVKLPLLGVGSKTPITDAMDIARLNQIVEEYDD